MKTGRVLSAVMEIEPRQHDMAGLDLGEGPPRRALIFGALALALWCLLLAPLLGVPNRYTFSIYFLPPMFLTLLGMRPSSRLSRRRALTDWALKIRYGFLGHRPLVAVGRRRPTRHEFAPLAERWRLLSVIWGRVVPAHHRPEWANGPTAADPDQPSQRPIGRPITITQRARLLSGDSLHALLVARKKR